METSELINQYMVKLGLKPADIVKRVGVSRGTVSLWRNGLSRPKGRNLFKLAEVLGLDAKDLDEGIETPTKRPIVENASIVGRIEAWDSSSEPDEDDVDLPFLADVELAAGDGTFDPLEHTTYKLKFAKSTLKRVGVPITAAVCVKVSGTSMEPVLPDGSVIGVNTSAADIVDGKMYAINHDGLLRVKLIYRLPGGGIRLRSYNTQEYPDESYSLEESQRIRIIGKVFWSSVLY